ncbi:hypothetical protein GJ697_04930 [Pseudoduganella sp. FT25W]|uniref:Uncharacterized protein n=1 Tax=Duganella alba TaxID=2666081 RepID=A0A6L5QBT1_9BURK|nr:hypothetical protein [Duganella alba]MRX07176.1 hypothetical protein [Duganella alba]MRX15129.1 hypothetical protein [Duganella alba]
MSEQSERENVPADFPGAQILGAVSGAAPKLLLVRTASGGLATPTQSSEERANRWRKCEVLAGKVARAAMRSKAEKCSHMSEEAILALYLPIMQTKFNARYDESVWIVRKAASILSWPLPKSM